MPRNMDFTRRQKSKESQAKSDVVSKFFVTWAQIVGRRWVQDLVYADLFAGAGYHEETGEKGTALIVIDAIARSPALHGRIKFVLNDGHKVAADSALDAVMSYPKSNVIKSVEVGNTQMTPMAYGQFLSQAADYPTFWFLDPTGWSGLSLDGIVQLTESRYNDLVFFLSYENINRFITEASVQSSLAQLFGVTPLQHIHQNLNTCRTPEQREKLIVTTLRQSLMEQGRYSECMRFSKQGTDGTSHYLIFVTKHPKGRRAFLSNVSAQSNWTEFGMPITGFGSGRATLQPSLFPEHGYEQEVEELLSVQFKGRTLTVDKVIDQFFHPSISLPEAAVKYLIQGMEARGLVSVDVPAERRPMRNGRRTLGPSRIVTFH